MNGTGFFPVASSDAGAPVFEAAFTCTFHAADGTDRIHTQVATMAFVSSTQLQGIVPVWKERPCTATVSLLLRHRPINVSVPHASASTTAGLSGLEMLTHTFKPAFARVQELDGSTEGGSVMVVRGYALPGDGNYECRHVGVTGIRAYAGELMCIRMHA